MAVCSLLREDEMKPAPAPMSSSCGGGLRFRRLRCDAFPLSRNFRGASAGEIRQPMRARASKIYVKIQAAPNIYSPLFAMISICAASSMADAAPDKIIRNPQSTEFIPNIKVDQVLWSLKKATLTRGFRMARNPHTKMTAPVNINGRDSSTISGSCRAGPWSPVAVAYWTARARPAWVR